MGEGAVSTIVKYVLAVFLPPLAVFLVRTVAAGAGGGWGGGGRAGCMRQLGQGRGRPLRPPARPPRARLNPPQELGLGTEFWIDLILVSFPQACFVSKLATAEPGVARPPASAHPTAPPTPHPPPQTLLIFFPGIIYAVYTVWKHSKGAITGGVV